MKDLKIVVLKPICLVEVDRYKKTLSALYKELIKNKIPMIDDKIKVLRPNPDQLKSLNLSSKEVHEISKDSIVCVEVKDINNGIPKIIKELNARFSCSLENWFKFFDDQEEIEKIRSWNCTAIIPSGRV